MKSICFFGIYDEDYPRNKVLIQGFEENGFNIIHCHVNPRTAPGWKKYWLLWKAGREFRHQPFEFIWVAFPGHTCVWLAKIIFLRKKIIFDVFLSLHEANVSDRKVHKAWSFNGMKDYFLDWYSIRLPDIVTIDTNEQIKMFGRKYRLNQSKAMRIFLSSALPVKATFSENLGSKFIIHFHGSFIPLHGVEYIIRAAKLVESDPDLVFKLVGGGQQLQEMKALSQSLQLTNVEFIGRVPEYSDVLQKLGEGAIALGIFGISERGFWIIPNKIFEGMAYGKPMISADTPAMREIFNDHKNILFCQAGNPEDLAEKILLLKKDSQLRKLIGSEALSTFAKKLLPKKLVEDFLVELHSKT